MEEFSLNFANSDESKNPEVEHGKAPFDEYSKYKKPCWK